MQVAHDEDQATLTGGIGPALEVARLVDDVLHAFQEEGAALADVEEAFHPQHRFAVRVEQHGEPEAEHAPIRWLIESQREGLDGVRGVMMGRCVVDEVIVAMV